MERKEMDELNSHGERNDRNLEIPKGLSRTGRKAATAIVKTLKDSYCSHLGGCKLFYTPAEWKERGEQYARGSELVVVFDGGDAFDAFSFETGNPALFERMAAALERVGVYAECGNSWNAGIYKNK